MSEVDKPRDKLRLFGGPETSGEKGSWFGFLFKLFLFVGVCAGGFYGYQIYLERNGSRRYGGGFSGGGFGSGRGGLGEQLGSYAEKLTGNSKRFWWVQKLYVYMVLRN